MVSFTLLISSIFLLATAVVQINADCSKYSFTAHPQPVLKHFKHYSCTGYVYSESNTYTGNEVYFTLRKSTSVTLGESVKFAASTGVMYDYLGQPKSNLAVILNPGKVTFGKTGGYAVKKISFDTPDVNSFKSPDQWGRYILFNVQTTFKGCTATLPINVTIDFNEIGVC
ncbi:hypothetical protein HDU97_005113 [Phlyctochytrium planicorne]|nr:hypothetical protein HDU97_005113 [Phlyctochytrium planicorne]